VFGRRPLTRSWVIQTRRQTEWLTQ